MRAHQGAVGVYLPGARGANGERSTGTVGTPALGSFPRGNVDSVNWTNFCTRNTPAAVSFQVMVNLSKSTKFNVVCHGGPGNAPGGSFPGKWLNTPNDWPIPYRLTSRRQLTSL